jgi:uncharacterized protein (TIGR02145 family)
MPGLFLYVYFPDVIGLLFPFTTLSQKKGMSASPIGFSRFLLMAGLAGVLGCDPAGEEAPPAFSVTIGGQTWMSGNLSVTHFRNGDEIFRALTAAEWIEAGKEGRPAWCYYNDNPRMGIKYGILYNYHAIKDPRGLAPAGWHIPNDREWSELADFLGGWEYAGGQMKAISGWGTDGRSPGGSGFGALPGGYREGNYMSAHFMDEGKIAGWWTYSDPSPAQGPNVRLVNYVSDVLFTLEEFEWKGYSVRCVKD